MKILRAEFRTFEGDFYEVLNQISLLLKVQLECKILAANIYVDCENDGLKEKFEESFVMKIDKCIKFKYMYFLKMNDYVRGSGYCYKEIEDRPVCVGGLMAGRVMMDNDVFMTKEEYENNDMSKFMFYE